MSRQVSWNRQLGLAVALCALGGIAYWLEYKHKPAKEASEEQAKKLFQLKDTSVQSIKLIDAGKTLALVCTDFSAKLCKPGDHSKWEMVEPRKLKADDSNVNSFLSTLNSLSSNETIDLKEESADKKASLLKEYGLDPEARKSAKKIEVKTVAGETILYLGATHPIGESIFAVEENVEKGKEPTGKVNENLVYLVPSYFKSNLERDLNHWRDKKLFSVGSHDVEGFELNGPKVRVKGERRAGQWSLRTQSEELTGDIESIEQMLSAATYLTAKSFVAENKNESPAKAALKGFTPVINLTLQKEKGEAKEKPLPVTLTLYERKSKGTPAKVYGTVSNLDPLFELDPNSIERLNKSLKDLRLTKLITSMDRFSAKKIEFSGTPIGTPPLVLTQSDGKWAADKSPVAQEKVSDLLDRLGGNRIKDFVVGSAIPSGENDGLKLTLTGDKPEAQRQLVFWKKDGKLYGRDLLAKREEVFVIDPTVQDALPWDRNFFKPAPPTPKADAKSDHQKK